MQKFNLSSNILADFAALFFDHQVSIITKASFVGGLLAYWLLPVDFVPDFLLPFGIVDDGTALLTAVIVFTQVARKQLERKSLMSQEDINNDGGKNPNSIPKSGGWGFNEAALGCLALTGIIVLIVVTGVAVSILSGVWTFNGVLASIGSFFGQPTTAEVIPSRTIVTSLQPLGQLVSISVEVAKADIGVSVHTGGINLCGHSANHVAQGVIEAGVDITRIEEDSINYNEATDTYTLTLPPPNITSCRVEYIRQYERSGGAVACGVDWDTVRLLAQHQALSTFAADTIEGGILSRAERETTMLMQSFVRALTGSEVRVMYSNRDAEAALPPSCQPQLPRGWAYNEDQNSWVKTD